MKATTPRLRRNACLSNDYYGTAEDVWICAKMLKRLFSLPADVKIQIALSAKPLRRESLAVYLNWDYSPSCARCWNWGASAARIQGSLTLEVSRFLDKHCPFAEHKETVKRYITVYYWE